MRVKTGISGLDELMDGGFPRGRCVLVSGEIGTGKSIFAMQYIARGIMDYGELGTFVSLERKKEALYQDTRELGLHFQRLEKKRNLQLLGGPLTRLIDGEKGTAEIFSEILESIKAFESKRLALDGMGSLCMFSQDEFALWRELAKFKEKLAKLGCTSVLTSEIREGREELSRLGVEEEIADGVIVLYYEGEGLTRDRALEIRKMRGTEHSNQLHFFDITDKGIVIKKMPESPKVPGGRRSP
ncbi:MAG: hypothetical protein AVW06_04755 [Hadesarchaea archaeon DG-33-1]|nr:MAG: hypothetical protein AVW06_04755 [Hadesarchaea archaeon DG-33-1]